MSADVIKEFLVSLGYRVDSTGERKFVEGIKSASVEAAKLGAAAAAAAVAVTAAVTKMASELEDLYFMSQRTNASASNIKAIGFAASQMGSSVEGARGSIEGLAKFLRENPGGEGLIGSIGVQTRDVNGALRDTTDIMQDIGKRLSGMPQYRAIQYANVFGIDYKTLMALEQGVDKFSGRYKELLRRFGLNVDEATKKSHDLMVSWRDMKASAGILSTIVGTTLIGVFDELNHRWQSLDETTKQNIETTAKWAAGIVAGAALIAGGPLVWIAALGAGILALWDDYQVWKEGGKSLINWDKWKTEIDAATDGINGLISVIDRLSKASERLFKNRLGQWAADHAHSDSFAKQGSPVQRLLSMYAYAMGYDPRDGSKIPETPNDKQTSAGQPLGIRNNNPGNLRVPGTGDFQHFGSAQDGISALGRQLRSYYNGTSAAAGHRKLRTLKDIISTYAPSSENNTGAYIGALAKQMGVSPDAQLNLNDPAQLSLLMRGIVQHENGQNPYSAEMFNKAAGGSGGAGQGVSIDQSVTIQVHASDKPHEVASAIGAEMNGVNDRLVRNMKGAAA